MKLAADHEREIARVKALVTPLATSLFDLDAADAYEWTLYHLLQNESLIKDVMFPITYYRANGDEWVKEGEARPKYFDFGLTDYAGNVDDRTLSLIADVPPRDRAVDDEGSCRGLLRRVVEGPTPQPD